ncbi:MAG: ATP-binding protein [Candidatus Pacearchaeota archaeon]|nr:ATP-binding protein [Candidatus Pacearchaeota archaeon]
MKREELYTIFFRQQKQLEEEKIELVKRTLTKEAIETLALKMPIIITGVRRCGKSILLRLIKEELKLDEKNFFYINFNDDSLTNFTIDDFQKIIDFLEENNYKKSCFLFLDEIQEIDKWEKWIDRIKNIYPLFITGSNSKLSSKEISSTLTGRSVSLWLTPFSFIEFLSFKKVNIKDWKLDLKTQSIIRREFKEFLEIGGFPKRVVTGNKLIISELYNQILYRDIIKKFSKQEREIKELGLFLLSNPASLTSSRNISELTGIKNLSTIKNILNSFENSFLVFFLNKFDYAVKKQIQNPRKVYCIDNGFITTIGFKFSEDRGKLLENLVAIELKRRNNDIYYFCEKKECDFLVKEKTKISEAIQVCYDLNKENRDREINGLVKALEKFKLKEGLILTDDQEDEIKIKDKIIKVKPVWKWILEK